MVNTQDVVHTAKTWQMGPRQYYMGSKTRTQRRGLYGPQRVMLANTHQSGAAHVHVAQWSH